MCTHEVGVVGFEMPGLVDPAIGALNVLIAFRRV